MEPEFLPTQRTQVHRLPERGHYDRETVYAILDEALICHLGYAVNGRPRVIPTMHARIDDTLYMHGSAASGTLKALKEGIDVCVAATIVDGLVMARSSFHSSINYRSVIVYGRGHEVTDRNEILLAAHAITEHALAGRGDEARVPNDSEIKQTTFLALPIDEASAKIRIGPPKDDQEDYALPIWAGIIPIRTIADPPIDDPLLAPGISPPPSVTEYRRPGAP